MVVEGRTPRSRKVRLVIAQGDVYWADLPDPVGSEPALRRPVVVVQSDALNASRLATVIVVPLTSNLKWSTSPGNVLLLGRHTGLPKDSVANVTQIISIDRGILSEHVGRVSAARIRHILEGINLVLRNGE